MQKLVNWCPVLAFAMNGNENVLPILPGFPIKARSLISGCRTKQHTAFCIQQCQTSSSARNCNISQSALFLLFHPGYKWIVVPKNTFFKTGKKYYGEFRKPFAGMHCHHNNRVCFIIIVINIWSLVTLLLKTDKLASSKFSSSY